MGKSWARLVLLILLKSSQSSSKAHISLHITAKYRFPLPSPLLKLFHSVPQSSAEVLATVQQIKPTPIPLSGRILTFLNKLLSSYSIPFCRIPYKDFYNVYAPSSPIRPVSDPGSCDLPQRSPLLTVSSLHSSPLFYSYSRR